MSKKMGQKVSRFVLPEWGLPGEGERYLDCVERHDCLDANKSLDEYELFKVSVHAQRTRPHFIGSKRMVVDDRE